MHAVGPYRIPNVDVEAHLVYTNHQPSGSVRAPTAPQVCWALEQHIDEVAARARAWTPSSSAAATLVDTGVEGPSGQMFGEIGAAARRSSARPS